MNVSHRAPLYLDYNATAPLSAAAAKRFVAALSQGYANPESQHEPGRQARRALEAAREAVGAQLGADVTSLRGDRVIFTSGGTEANNLALFGVAQARRNAGLAPRVIVSSVEHPSVLAAAAELARQQWRMEYLHVDSLGIARLEHLAELLKEPAALVALMLANNETGAIQPVAEAAQICASRGVPLHCDAVQAVGRLPLHFQSLGAATMAIAAHKFEGPPGIGALIVRGNVTLEPTLRGGFQQAAIRPGTESPALALGLQSALEESIRRQPVSAARWQALRDRFESGLKQAYAALAINAEDAPRLAQTSNVAFVGLDRQALLMALDIEGVACSTGSACASGSSEPSHVLTAMKLDDAVVGSSLRFSFGHATTPLEIDDAVLRIAGVTRRLSSS